MNRLPRLLSAVPQTWPVRLEIAKAIRRLAEQVAEEEECRREAQRDAIRRDCELAVEALREACRTVVKAGFRPDQPRWRKGSGRRSGRWSGGAGIAAGRIISARLRGGHHYVPRQVFAKQRLKPETRRVFEHAVTGPLSPGVHGWDDEHKTYNKAVHSLWGAFLKQYGITADEMTPAQAGKFLDKIKHSNNPVIRNFNSRLRP